MSLPASVEGSERLRLFCALRLPHETAERLTVWQREALAGVPEVRPLPPEHLHLTLAFLGHRSVEELDAILGALREAAAPAEPSPPAMPTTSAPSRMTSSMTR